jgi:Flp pilus assembly protein TadD
MKRCLALLPLLTVAVMPAATPARLTFYRDIAPIVYTNCAPCHRPGESGPFSLLSYEDVKRHALQIADVTKTRFMPPWLPEPGHGEFDEERRLSDEQINLIQAWVKQGAIAGSIAHAPTPPKFSSEWQLGPPDLIVRAAQPYQLPADAGEVFWNFIMPVPVSTVKWVKAIEVRPGTARVFHHANVILDRSRSSRRQETKPGYGFAGMDLSVEEETFDPDGHFLSWKPGSEPVVEPDGMAWRADPGMDLILNVHLRSTGKPETIAPEIGLYFTDKPRTKFPMLVQLEHDLAIDIPAGDKDFLVSDDFRVPMDMKVLTVYPHAHYTGKLMEGYATLPDGTRQWIIRIPNWDLNWQGVFRLKQPLFLPKGTVVSMRYHYDNSADNPRNPNRPPQRILFGNNAGNEMGHLWLQVLPVADGDQRALLQEALMRQRLEKYPTDFSANYNVGDLLLTKGDAAGAIAYFERAAADRPTSAIAATELGVALLTAGRVPEAAERFRQAISADPNYTSARFGLASADAASGHFEAAAAGFKEVLKDRPDDEKANQHLGEVLILWGDEMANSDDSASLASAVAHYREALIYRPADADLHTTLGVALARSHKFNEAQIQFQVALSIDPGFQPAKEALAKLQAVTRKR